MQVVNIAKIMPTYDKRLFIFPWRPAQRDDALALLPVAQGRYFTESAKWHRGSYERLPDMEMDLRRLSRTTPETDTYSEGEVSNQRVTMLQTVRQGTRSAKAWSILRMPFQTRVLRSLTEAGFSLRLAWLLLPLADEHLATT